VDGNPVECTWSVTLEGAAVVKPVTGKETALTAAKDGPLTLTATTAEGGTASVPVVAVPAQQAGPRGSLPLIGTGYGGITIAILAVSVAGALTAIDKLPGAALATLLGTVVSYFFVQQQRNGGSAGDGQTRGRSGSATDESRGGTDHS
jgi:hypothetical protein